MDAQTFSEVKGFFDEETHTITYVITDKQTNSCAVLDSVLDLDYASGKINYLNADKIINFITENNLKLCWLIETHVHADHLSAAPYIQQNLGGKIVISKEIVKVQEIFGKVFNAGTEFERDGSQFDLLLEDGDTYKIGNLRGKALHTPGHTPACMAHVIEDTVFVGDTLFRSIQKILALPDNTRMFVCHDYMPNGREVKWETTVSEQKQNNIHIGGDINEDEFVKLREKRDSTLGMPKLIIPSIQVNMRAGNMPPSEDNGSTFLKVPISGLKGLR